MFKLDMNALRKNANFEAQIPANAANAANAANFSRVPTAIPDKLAELAELAGSGDSTIRAAQGVGAIVIPTLAALATADPAALPDPDRWCWPHSSAMTGREIDTMVERTAMFNRRGLPALNAELLADKLVTRDRGGDDRRLCLECAHLSRAGGAMRCAQWQRAGLGTPNLPAGLALQLQRCGGFKPQIP